RSTRSPARRRGTDTRARASRTSRSPAALTQRDAAQTADEDQRRHQDRADPEHALALPIADEQLVDAGNLRRRPAAEHGLFTRQPVDGVEQQIAVAEVAEQRVGREVGIAVDDQPAGLRRTVAYLHTSADDHGAARIAAGQEFAAAAFDGAEVRRAPA